AEVRDDLESAVIARDAHELMRSLEVSSILDCAEMAAHASLFRTESRWGLYHNRIDYPQRDDANWFCHTLVRKSDGQMVSEKRAIHPYIVPIENEERTAYDRLRVSNHA
ncbi:MAG: fumarate reductase/succinate dehydrogenase flavoprotein subunit, partial [Mesorhizobium sp.]